LKKKNNEKFKKTQEQEDAPNEADDEEIVTMMINRKDDDDKKQEQIVIPKRHRIEFFNNDDVGKKLRLTAQSSMDHLPIYYRRNKCLLCYCDTTVRCSTCQVQLCKNPFGTNTRSCYEIFHYDDILQFNKRNNGEQRTKLRHKYKETKDQHDAQKTPEVATTATHEFTNGTTTADLLSVANIHNGNSIEQKDDETTTTNVLFQDSNNNNEIIEESRTQNTNENNNIE
jgi:hypothetical protein